MEGLTRKIVIFFAVMIVVGAGGWFGRKAYKKATENRLITKARNYMEAGDGRAAGLLLQRAMQVNPLSDRAASLIADLLEGQGAPAALSWRLRAAQLKESNPEYRLAWAKTALKVGDLKGAQAAMDGISEKDRNTVEYYKMAGALAWGLNKREEAERHYREAQKLEPNGLASVMNLATIHLASTNQEVVAAGRQTLEQVTTNAEYRLPAL